MPVYEYRCANGCEEYEIWRSIEDRNTGTDCPSCGGNGIRLFHPPMALTGPLRLKQSSAEPKLVSKPSNSPEPRPRIKESTSRPWMVTRGC
ncbi:MAG: zinc ribbon domain-containing protein [Synechococcaceae cyanobacterium]